MEVILGPIPLEILPEELITKITKYLRPLYLIQLSLTSKKFYNYRKYALYHWSIDNENLQAVVETRSWDVLRMLRENPEEGFFPCVRPWADGDYYWYRRSWYQWLDIEAISAENKIDCWQFICTNK